MRASGWALLSTGRVAVRVECRSGTAHVGTLSCMLPGCQPLGDSASYLRRVRMCTAVLLKHTRAFVMTVSWGSTDMHSSPHALSDVAAVTEASLRPQHGSDQKVPLVT